MRLFLSTQPPRKAKYPICSILYVFVWLQFEWDRFLLWQHRVVTLILPPGRPIRLLVCIVNFSETLFTLSYTLLYLNTTKCCDLLAGSRRNFFSGVWRKVCGRRVTRGWSDHAVNGDSISQGALERTAQKATSRLADGMERRFGQRSQELIGWFVESWRMQGCRCLLIGWLWCTGGLWVDGYVRELNPTPLWSQGGQWCVKVGQTLIVLILGLP